MDSLLKVHLLLLVWMVDSATAVTSGRYRIPNWYEGVCRSLEPGGGSGLKMVRTDHTNGQFWDVKVHPRQSNMIRLSQNNQALTLISSDAVAMKPVSPTDSMDQYWTMKRNGVPSEAEWFRLVSKDGTKCLGVTTTSQTPVNLLKDGDYTGNYWRLDTIEKVTGVPRSLRLSTYYRKYINMGGIPVVSSSAVPDKALYQAYFVARHMLSKSPAVLRSMVQRKAKIAVIGRSEHTTSIPEHRHLGASWNSRTRGVGGTVHIPTASCAEENLLCYRQDRYSIEDIFIHEFSHSISNLGIHFASPGFTRKVKYAYQRAIQAGKYRGTYAATNDVEYFAEGVQNWFNVNGEANPPNGIHNHINTKSELATYDPELYKIIAQYFPDDGNKCSCH